MTPSLHGIAAAHRVRAFSEKSAETMVEASAITSREHAHV